MHSRCSDIPRLSRWQLVAGWSGLIFYACTLALASEDSGSSSFGPEPLTEEDFRALIENSPFTRTVRLTDSLVLTGIARLGGAPVVTLLDAEDGSSITISESPNERGWKLIEIRPSAELEGVMVSMAFETGEVIRIRHDMDRIKSTTQRLGYERRAQAQRAAAMRRIRESAARGGDGHGVPREKVRLLETIERNELPGAYNPGVGGSKEAAHRMHQNYVDRRLEGMSARQRGRVGQLWKEKQAVDPLMQNRGASFVRIMEHVAENEPR